MPHAQSKADISAVTLPRIVDLDTIEPVRAALLDALRAGTVTVDGAAVERIATNALFMLLSAGETAHRSGTGLALVSPSAAVTTAIARLGLAPAFAPYIEG